MRSRRYDLGFISDPGNRRADNQDSLIIRRGELDGREFVLLAVADGMGGLTLGDRASYTAALLLDQWWDSELPPILSRGGVDWDALSASLSVVVEHINWTIRSQRGETGGKSGTTLSLLFLMDDHYLLKHVGDSRIYLFRKQGVLQLTRDQTWCQREIDRGTLTPAQAAAHRMRHVLVSALGVNETYQCQEDQGQTQSGDWFLLCSDGFYNEVAVSPRWPALWRDAAPQDILADLLQQIKAGPAGDNVSAVLLRVTGGGWLT